ncbi:hypothetical protein N7523_010352 [Penicillium sp. IBT 18751x]|nr:hypothetical protein N7523_010352 [Penicillium sp. IBT 18751x]
MESSSQLIPHSQQAAVVQNPGECFQVVLQHDIPVGNPGSNEILVKLKCTGICHSEVRAVLAWGAYNSIIGHEGIGTVVQIGDNVSDSLLGKRVGIKWLYNACTECSVCQRGFANNCAKQLNTSRHVPGTLQQYTIVDARFITMIPEGVSDEVAAPLLCAGLTMAGALGHLDNELQPGDWVVISGSGGGLGHIGVQIAARVRKLRVIAIDSGDAKRKLSLQSGAEAFIDFKTEDVAARVLELTEEGAHATVVVPALTIKGSSVGTEEQMAELLQLAAQGVITPAIEIFDFEEAPNLINRIMDDAIVGRAVVRLPHEEK